ncbi:hypothetical protein [Lonsdalea britannica]|uniref:hypothetical protein n=1 Tax=Lonsdalea britannica TaxID=1082704 RepID=UPI0015940D90|nr:hypothetical protein [Lonsdalea britannica]
MSSIQGDEVLQMMIPTEHHAKKTPLRSHVAVAFHQSVRLDADARKAESILSLTALLYR